jgi:hypothetical protein
MWSICIPRKQLSRSVNTSLRVAYQHRLYAHCHCVARRSRKQEPSGITEHYPGGVGRTLVEMDNERHRIIIIIIIIGRCHSVMESSSTHREVTAKRPDIIIKNKKRKHLHL